MISSTASIPHLPGPHLSDEQLADLLADVSPASEATTHLASCTLCQRELHDLRISLQDFSDLSLTWAEQQAPRRVPVPSRAALLWQRVPVWPAVAAALAAAVILPVVHRHPASPSTPVSVARTAPPASATVASSEEDDRLLSAVDRELRLGEQSSVSATELGLATHASGTESVTN